MYVYSFRCTITHLQLHLVKHPGANFLHRDVLLLFRGQYLCAHKSFAALGRPNEKYDADSRARGGLRRRFPIPLPQQNVTYMERMDGITSSPSTTHPKLLLWFPAWWETDYGDWNRPSAGRLANDMARLHTGGHNLPFQFSFSRIYAREDG